MIMKETTVRKCSSIGMFLCAAYVLVCIGANVYVSGDMWDYSRAVYSMSGGTEDVMYMGWSLKEVNIILVALIAVSATSFIIPHSAYFMRLRKTGKYSFWLFDVSGSWAKVFSLLYTLLGLSLMFSLFMMVTRNGNDGAMVGEMVDREKSEGLLYFVYIVLLTPIYWISGLLLWLLRRKS